MKDKLIHWFAAFGLLSLTAAVFLAIGLTVPALPGLQRTETIEIKNSDAVLGATQTANVDGEAVPTSTSTSASAIISSPTETSVTSAKTSSSTVVNKTTKIAINTATKDELMSIKGIGESFAERIIAYREEHGGFKSLEELKNISGVGEKRYANWVPYFSIN